jgi:RNA polymerase sigma-70 factor, ECF subfamily
MRRQMEFQSFDQEYVRRLTEGDRFVENDFSAYFSQLLLLKLRRRLRSPELLQDVMQETLLRVLQTLRVKGGLQHPERLGAFVNSVCNNVLLEHLRSERKYRARGEDAPDTVDDRIDLDATLINLQRTQQVKEVLDELSERDRNLLRMIFFEERDKAEVCRELGVDAAYLRVLLHRAKGRFRDTMVKNKIRAL